MEKSGSDNLYSKLKLISHTLQMKILQVKIQVFIYCILTPFKRLISLNGMFSELSLIPVSTLKPLYTKIIEFFPCLIEFNFFLSFYNFI